MAHNTTLADTLSAMASKLLEAQNTIDTIKSFGLDEWQNERMNRIDDNLGTMVQDLAIILGNVMIYNKAK